eukprot:tig00000178_g12767.t1
MSAKRSSLKGRGRTFSGDPPAPVGGDALSASSEVPGAAVGRRASAAAGSEAGYEPSVVSAGNESAVLMESEDLKERKLEDAFFGVLYTLCERAAKRKSMFKNFISVFLLQFIDFLQLLGLSMTTGDTWSSDVVGWLQAITNIYTSFMNTHSGILEFFFWLSASCVFIAISLSVLVWYNFRTQRFMMLPVKILRVVVKIMLTAFYITIINFFMWGVRCGEKGSEENLLVCWSAPHLIYLGVSIIALLLFVPYACLMALVYHDRKPLSRDIESRPHGRFDFLYLLIRTAMVLITALVPASQVAAINFTIFVLMLLAAAFLIVVQPFYRPRINAFRCALMTSAAVFALCSCFLSFLDTGAKLVASVACLLLSIAALPAGYYISLMYVRKVLRRHINVEAPGPARLATVDEAGEERAAAGEAGADGAGFEATGALNAGGSFARRVTKAALSESDDLNDEDFSWRRLFLRGYFSESKFLSEGEVEVATRFLRRDRSPEALERAEAIYKRGMAQFPDSSYVRICYASYLIHFRKNAPSGLLELKGAWSTKPRFDMRFALSSIRRDWEQMNTGGAIGEELNFVGMLEFKRFYGEAQKHHKECLRLLKAFWRYLAKKSNGNLGTGVVEDVPKKLAGIYAEKRLATSAYENLVKKYPNSKVLLRAYGTYLEDVGNEPEKAAVQFQRADEIEEKEAKLRGAGSSQGDHSRTNDDSSGTGSHSQGTGSEGSSQAGQAKKRRRRGREYKIQTKEVDAVKRLSYGIITGLIVLMTIVAVTYVVVRDLFEQYGKSINRSRTISQERRAISDITYYVRSLNLIAFDNDAETFKQQQDLLNVAVDEFLKYHRMLYLTSDPGNVASSDATVRTAWTTPSIAIESWNPGPPERITTQLRNLWDAGNLYSDNAREFQFARMEDLVDVQMNPLFRFVIRNGVFGILDGSRRAVTAYTDEVDAPPSPLSPAAPAPPRPSPPGGRPPRHRPEADCRCAR